MNGLWGLIIAVAAAGATAIACVLSGRRARRRDRGTLEARHRETLESRDANFARQSLELEAISRRLATCIEGASQCAHALEAEKKRSNQLANQLDQLAGQLESERTDAAARLGGARAAQKVAEDQAESLGRALDEIRRIVDAAKVSLGEAGTALDQIRVGAVNGGNGGEPGAAPWPGHDAGAPKPH